MCVTQWGSRYREGAFSCLRQSSATAPAIILEFELEAELLQKRQAIELQVGARVNSFEWSDDGCCLVVGCEDGALPPPLHPRDIETQRHRERQREIEIEISLECRVQCAVVCSVGGQWALQPMATHIAVCIYICGT